MAYFGRNARNDKYRNIDKLNIYDDGVDPAVIQTIKSMELMTNQYFTGNVRNKEEVTEWLKDCAKIMRELRGEP